MEERTKNSENNNNSYSLEELVKKGIIRQSTYDKVKIGTSIIEKKYFEKETQFEKNEKIYHSIVNYFNNIKNLSYSDKEEIKKNLFKKIGKYAEISHRKIMANEFEILSEIGKGGFGKVRLCRNIKTNQCYAMKKLKFDLLINKAQLFHINTEKNIMSLNDNNIWKAKLNYSFINNGYLYFIMDYYPGGDLLNYMYEKDILTEEEARFYIAEIILGVDSLHKNNCIHRDIKPDNIFIDQNGHLKIGDFGLSILSTNVSFPYTYKWRPKWNNYNIYNNQDEENYNYLIGMSNVGSLLYVSPEIIEKKIYGAEVDWWSVGIIFYEMLIGFPPFFSKYDSPKETGLKIKNFKKYLQIPKEKEENISQEAKQLIFDFLCEREKRLGKNGIDEIKKHIFFKNFDWDNVRDMVPPFIPKLFDYNNEDYQIKKRLRNSLQFYTSKEKINKGKNLIEIRQQKEKENEFKRINLNFYNFDYNKELAELKYNIENNITDLIKAEIDNFVKNNNRSVNNTQEDTSTEEIASLKSSESSQIKIVNINKTNKKNKENTKICLSKSYYSTDFKNKFGSKSVLRFYKNKNMEKSHLNIIPVKNIINREKSLNKTLNKSLNNSNRKEKDYFSYNGNNLNKSTLKSGYSEEYNKIRIINNGKIMDKNNKNKNIVHKGSCFAPQKDIKTLKINGKLIMVKKNLGKLLMNQ